MELNDFFPPSSSTRKERSSEQPSEYDENGIYLKLSLGAPPSIDLRLSLSTPPVPLKNCTVCKCTRTPTWRTGPKGRQTLCNACGLQYKKFEERRKDYQAAGILKPDYKGIDREFAKLAGEN